KPALPLAMKYNTAAATMPPRTWAITYGISSDALKRPPITSPKETAGFKWTPETGPIAKAIVSTVSPKASATPSSPIPTCGNAADSTALPQPPNTSQKAPRNSAAARLVSDIEIPLSLSFCDGREQLAHRKGRALQYQKPGDSRSRTLAPRPPLPW